MEGISRGFTPTSSPRQAAPDPTPESVVGRQRGSTEQSLPEKALSSRNLAATSLPGNWQEQLIEAARKGDIPAASALLELGADPNANTSGSGTPLWLAAQHGYAELAKLLLAKGADINAGQDPCDDNHPIKAAIASGNVSLFQLLRGSTNLEIPEVAESLFLAAVAAGNVPVTAELLERTINASQDPCDDNHPIQAAIASGNVSLFQLLRGGTNLEIPKVADSLFLSAVAAGNVPVTAELLERTTININWCARQAPISVAARSGHLDTVAFLLERGANINTVGTGRDTAITSASMNGHLNLVEFLLDKGADITAGRTGDGTPIREAALAGHLKVVQLLLARGANIEADGRGYWTPLSAAAEGGHYDVVEYLLDMGASVHADTYFQGNPIGVAARKGYLAIVKLLVKRSALIDVGSPPPLCFAVWYGQHEVVEYLCQQGVNVNNGGLSTPPICTAAAKGYLEIVRTLHHYGADVNAPTVVGQKGNALSAAWSRRHFLVAHYLMDHGADFPSANQRREQEAAPEARE